jgi:hypothetical protein
MKDQTDTVEEIERELANLAGEMSGLIESGPVEEREALHDYAVSLVRDRLPVVLPAGVTGREEEEGDWAERSESADSSETRAKTGGSTGASLVGYGVLVVPVGVILLPLFPPLGVTLLGVGVFMVLFGGLFGILGKLTPSRSET